MSQELLVALIVVAVILVIMVVVTLLTRGSALVDVEMRFSSPLPPERLRAEALGDLLALMAREEYALAEAGGDRLVFTKAHRPRWTYYFAALTWIFGPLLWILGVLALRRRKWLRVTVAATDTGGASAIVAGGTMTLRINRALREFFAGS